MTEGADFVESFRRMPRVEEDCLADERDGDGSGEIWSGSRSSDVTDFGVAFAEMDFGVTFVEVDFRVGSAETVFGFDSGPVRGLGGKGKTEARLIFNRGKRKRLVLNRDSSWGVDTPRSPTLWSEREDSESRASVPEVLRESV